MEATVALNFSTAGRADECADLGADLVGNFVALEFGPAVEIGN